MKIKKIQIKDFQGITGNREYMFPEKITVLAAPNGQGKTSLLNAIRFGITGKILTPNLIRKGADKCDIGLELENGHSLIREVRNDGKKLFWVDKKRVTQTDCDKSLSAYTGSTATTAYVATASELIGKMKPQALSEFMLRYIPETLDPDTVVSNIENITPGAEDLLRNILPDTFGIDTLEGVYKEIYEKRRIKKKERDKQEGLLRALGNPEKPRESREMLLQALSGIEADKSALAKYNAEIKAYTETREARKKQEKIIEKLTEEYNALPDVAYDPQEVKDLKDGITAKREQYGTVHSAWQALFSSSEALRKAIETLEQPVCPLSEKLTCTTDKSVVKKELTDAYLSSADEEEKLKAQAEQVKKAIEEDMFKYRHLEEAYKHSLKKESLKKRLDQAKSTLPELKQPVKPQIREDISEREIRDKLARHDTAERVQEEKKRLTHLQQEVHDLEILAMALAPKGPVKNAITSDYIMSFENVCNAKADELKKSMRLRFLVGEGITPLLDVNGTGNYLPFASLSGGEKIYMVFLLLDMINQMTGIKILFLDELSVLDKERFATLLNVIEHHTEEYDQIFLTTVDHEGLMEVLKEKGLPATTEL